MSKFRKGLARLPLTQKKVRPPLRIPFLRERETKMLLSRKWTFSKLWLIPNLIDKGCIFLLRFMMFPPWETYPPIKIALGSHVSSLLTQSTTQFVRPRFFDLENNDLDSLCEVLQYLLNRAVIMVCMVRTKSQSLASINKTQIKSTTGS